MHDSNSGRNAVEVLAEEFLARYRNGERPPLSDYTQRYPELADKIQDLFPALLMMEHVKPVKDDGVAAVRSRFVASKLDQLGDYRIIGEVGRGGMGIVYEAEQVSLGRHVALKVLPHQSLLDDRHKRRFEREAKAAARLHHTNIVPVFGVGEQDGSSYYVMQFIQGLGLDAVIDELKRLKAADKSTTNLAPGDPELRVSRRPAVSAARASASAIARSLIEGNFVEPATGADDAGVAVGATMETVSSPAPVITRVGEASRPESGDTAALHEGGAHPAATHSDTAAGKLSDAFALSGSFVPPWSQSGSDSGAKRGRQSYWQSVSRIGIQVASALQYAHDQGVLHRDIKPANLLLDLRGTVWVTDFGLAKSNDQPEITRTGDILGTLRYMPPEAFEGKMDSRSDVYSLGLTLYELLALKPAFDDRDRHKLIKQVTAAEVPPLEKLNPEIPRDLATIVHKAMDRDSERRYQTACEMQADLQRFVVDQPVKARPLTLRERGWRWCRHNPVVATLSSGLFLALVAVTAASTFAYFQESAHRGAMEIKTAAISQALHREKALKVAERNAKQAATQSLYRSLVDQARANRMSRRIGQRVRSLEVLAVAARMARETSRPEDDFLELRNEAIASLILPDVKLGRPWNGWPPGTHAINADGRLDRYVRTDREGMVSVRSIKNDAEIWSFRGLDSGDAWPLFSPDGRLLVVWSLRQQTIKTWKLDGPQPVLLLDKTSSSWPAFSPDSRQLACRAAGDSIVVFALDSGRPLRQFNVGSRAEGLAWHPSGRLLAITVSRGVQIRDTETGTVTAELPHPGGTYAVAWHPLGGTLAAVGADNVIQIWDVASRRPTVQLKGHTSAGVQFTFSHDGSLLASIGWDGTFRLWDPPTGELTFQCPMNMPMLPFRADERWLEANYSETTELLNPTFRTSRGHYLRFSGGRRPSQPS